jgi:hypothetical protein
MRSTYAVKLKVVGCAARPGDTKTRVIIGGSYEKCALGHIWINWHHALREE